MDGTQGRYYSDMWLPADESQHTVKKPHSLFCLLIFYKSHTMYARYVEEQFCC